MRARRVTLTALSTLAAAVGVVPVQAHAAVGTTIYVDNANAQCSDSGSGTQAAPFCSINAAGKAAVPGSTVLVEPGTGHYVEPMQLIGTSGTPGSPITYQAAPGTFTIGSSDPATAAAGLFFDETVHDIVIQGFDFTGGLTISEDSARFTVAGNRFQDAGIGAGDGDDIEIRDNTVTGSSISVEGAAPGLSGRSENNPTIVDGNTVTGGSIYADIGSTIITHNTVSGSTGFGVLLGTNASVGQMVGTQMVVSDNLIYDNKGGGIWTAGYADTITGNTIADNGGNQIEVHPHPPIMNVTPPSPLPTRHIEDNVIATGTALPHQTWPTPALQAGIAIDQAAWTNAAIDDNVVTMPTGVDYQVGSTLVPDGPHLAALGHGGLGEINSGPDLNADGSLQAGSPAIDSADSNAADEQTTDILGNPRHDDTGVCDTGTGTRTYDDRGAFEFQGTTSPTVACPAPAQAVPTPTPPSIASIDFPASGSYFGVGRAGTFQVTDHTGGKNTVGYSFDGGAVQTVVADVNGLAAVPYTAPTAGLHWLDVHVVSGGVASMDTRYLFTVTATDTVVGPTAYATVTAAPANKRSITVDTVKSLHGTTPIRSYSVDFGDGASTGATANPSATHTYQTDGVFPVAITVTDTDGLTDTMTTSYNTATGLTSTPPPTTSYSYVNDEAGADCADTGVGIGGPGAPYCTISAAVAAAVPGELIQVAAGTYPETLQITNSGTPGNPIRLQAAPGPVKVAGATIGRWNLLTHDVSVSGFTFTTSGVTVGDSQNITLAGDTVGTDPRSSPGSFYAVNLGGVSNVSVVGDTINPGTGDSAISVDATSLRVALSGNTVVSPNSYSPAGPGISVAAPDSTVVGNRVSNTDGYAISIATGADHSVVANNLVTCSERGIDVNASDTAVTGNTVMQEQDTEIAVNGPVAGVSVENNIAAIPDNSFYCGQPNGGSLGLTGISVDSQSTAGTTVDYNDVYFPYFTPYQWGVTSEGLAGFQKTGQGLHDSAAWVQLDAHGVPKPGSPVVDSADSAAPGEQLTDLLGNPRVDDPATPDTGTGPRLYDDRGAIEYQPATVTPPPPPGGGSTPPPPPPPPAEQPVVSRVSGGDRYGTSVDVSQAQWRPGSAGGVVLATGGNFPDALSGVPLAARVHGPLLLTATAALDPATSGEISRVLGPDKSKTVYILGGYGVVSPAVEKAVRDLGYKVTRYGGGDRFATSLMVAESFGPTKHVIVATGMKFADALAAGPLGAVEGAPIVLSKDDQLDPATAAFVQGHPAIEAVGWQAVHAVAGGVNTSGKTVSTLAGDDRYLTSSAVAGALADALGHAPAGVGVASGANFPDALTGGAYAANAGQPLLLTDPQSLSDSTGATLSALAAHLSAVTLFGGSAAIAPTVETTIADKVNGRIAD